MRLMYRMRQFFGAMPSQSKAALLAEASEVLSPDLLLLFRAMERHDQAHSVRVLRSLKSGGIEEPSLLAAALLHDVGKSRHPLRRWERAVIVLAKSLFPAWVERLGRGEPRGWRRPFVIAEQHPRWGAEMVAEVGGSPKLIKLIAAHQNEPEAAVAGDLYEALRILQAADNRN